MEHLRYMRAWLRLNSATYHNGWSDQDVVDSFWLIELPEVPYSDWEAAVTGKEQEPEQEQVNRGDPVERLKNEGGHLFEKGIVQLGD